MPGKIKVKILAGRNLPVMDRSGDTTDAYVELKFGNVTYKTDVCRKSLNPQWNSEWYKFEVDDAELQDEPLQIRLMDHDTYSANDAIGKVYLNLNPLLLPGPPPTVKNIWTLEASLNTSVNAQGGSILTGWIPVFDTMHGIRGEVNIIVKVDLFLDFNKFRQSSCGVQFFYSPIVPYGYHAQVIHGFVEELIVSDDPEYKWIDKIRTPRASNEARQTLFFKLSGEVQRKIGLKALDLGGNAVIGYCQNFDLEGESGIVARGIGTAVTLVKLHDFSSLLSDATTNEDCTHNFKTKLQSDCSESDDSLKVISQSKNSSPLPSPSNAQTTLNNTFPLYGVNIPRQPKTPLKLLDYKSNNKGMSRQGSLQFPQGNTGMKRSPGSTLSLTDDMLDPESSMRSMLALEDMRGEPVGNRFSRGLRNLRNLHQTVLSKKVSKPNRFDSVDEETDLESAFSSSWSICESDTKSSIIDLPQRVKKKFIQRKPATEGMAALLIKSVHSLPLHSVREDRETPTPSPVNCIEELENCTNQPTQSLEIVQESKNDDIFVSKVIVNEESSRDNLIVPLEAKIPMVSSSESDTSTSDEDPSESSTNYNLLDDTISLLDHTSPEASPINRISCNIAVFEQHMQNTILKFSDKDASTDDLVLSENLEEINDQQDLYDSPKTITENLKTESIVDMSILENEQEVNSTKILEACSSKTLELVIPVEIDASIIEKVDTEITFPIQNVLSTEKVGEFQLIDPTYELVSSDLQKPHVSEIHARHRTSLERKPRVDSKKHKLYKQASVSYSADDDNDLSSESDEEYYGRHHRNLLQVDRKLKENKDEGNLDVNEEFENILSSSNQIRSKSPKKVERTDTVIYKGPIKDNVKFSKSPPVAIDSQNPKQITDLTVSSDTLHLQVPPLSPKDRNLVSPYPQTEVEFARNTHKQYRQSRMIELMKTVDAKMFSSNHKDKKDFGHRRKFEKGKVTPSPEAHRRSHRDRSKSPDPLITSPLRQYPGGSAVPSQDIELKLLSHPITSKVDFIDTKNENSQLLGLLSPSQKSIDLKELHGLAQFTPEANLPQSKSTKNTNIANAIDKMCVPHSSTPRRPHQGNHEQQQHPTQQEDADVGTLPVRSTTPSPAVAPAVVSNVLTNKPSNSPVGKNNQPAVPLHRRSSDSDLSITPKGNSLTGSDRSMGGYLKPTAAIVRTMNQDTLEMLEYPFLTLQQYPPGFIIQIGGLVSAKSVKLLERITNLEEPEGRDAWWIEIRMEVRSHARALACNVVIGYKEETSICDDVCVLSASGTAAVINLNNANVDSDLIMNRSQIPVTNELDKTDKQTLKTATSGELVTNQSIGSLSKPKRNSESNDNEPSYILLPTSCSICHLPYNKNSMNFQVSVSKCSICRRGKVPDVLFTTFELPDGIPITGRASFIQATVCKNKRDVRGELNAKEISDCLPFLEYELHSLLLNKLKVRGMNAIFGLRIQVSIGEKLIVGMAAGTAVFLTALPAPSLPQISSSNSWQNEDQIAEIQRKLLETLKKNIEFYQLKPLPDIENGKSTSDTDESEEDLPELDLGLGMKDVCVLEVDDIEDMDKINLLMDEQPPNDFYVVNIESIPGLEDLEIVRNLQMFTQVSRAKIPQGQMCSMPSKYCTRLLQTVYFKLRRMVPCAVCDIQFKISLPEQDEIQLSVVGIALGLGEPTKFAKYRRKPLNPTNREQLKKPDDSDMIFSLDEDHSEANVPGEGQSNLQGSQNATIFQNNNQTSTLNTNVNPHKPRTRSPMRIKSHTLHHHKYVPLKERYGVDITPLSYLPGGKIDRYLGNLNFFFIRESNSIRESGGLSGFMHSFVTEVLAIVRAHVTVLGGNAMASFFMNQCVLLHSPHKNQGQCLINVGGDVVSVSYFANDRILPSGFSGNN